MGALIALTGVYLALSIAWHEPYPGQVILKALVMITLGAWVVWKLEMFYDHTSVIRTSFLSICTGYT